MPDIDPYANDPGRWGASLVTLRELIIPCLDAAGARSVVEVGAYAGDFTAVLVEWAARSDARVWAVDPAPRQPLVELAERRPELELLRMTSHDALSRIPLPDVAIIDGDHNYYTVSRELRLLEQAQLLILHDVCWPHARRDTYFRPELIPDEHRQPIAQGAHIFPGNVGVGRGLPFGWAAAREGGPRNGVLTAIEDFAAERAGLRVAVVPAFFGLGVIWSGDAPWADALARVLEPWDRNPLLERLEANRALHLASGHSHATELSALRERVARQEAVLRRLLDSSAFSVAERLSALRLRAGIGVEHSAVSKDDVRRALAD